MALNKLALIRYKTLDECLKNRFRKWTLEDLIEKVSNALYEYEGITTGISKRSIQLDIQIMRSDKLGFNAPIVVTERKFYSYSEPNFSITNTPINASDIDKMKEIVSILKHMNGFSYFEEMSEMIVKLENNVNKSIKKSSNYIQFESNIKLKGLEHITPLYQSIIKKESLIIEYKSFKALKPQNTIYYPYLLKEYRNRWFLVCRAKNNRSLHTLALDRIISFHCLPNEKFEEYTGIDFERYYADLIGVTKSEKDRPCKVILLFDKETAPYVITKPMHNSQKVMREDEQGTLIRLDVVLNFELEREVLGFGNRVKVIAPRILESRIKKVFKETLLMYEKE